MKAIINGRIVLPHAVKLGAALLYDEKIVAVTGVDEARAAADEIIDAHNAYVCPGLIDVHIHGYMGEDVSDGIPEGVVKMAEGVAKNGVTSFLPTTMTIPWDELETAFGVVRRLMPESRKKGWKGAEILGVHSEGPFINKNKKGAQPENAILPPDIRRILPWKDVIRLMTAAPEVEGGMAFIRDVREQTDITVSIGHTDATYEEAVTAMNAGAGHVTHTFNAQSGLLHRKPGVVGAALTENVYAELIPDTFHVHPAIFRLMAAAKGDHLVLITDSLRSCGMPDGKYTLGGQTIILKGIECRLEDGTIAGSVLKLNKGVKNLRDYASLTMQEAVYAASLAPARSIKVDDRKGSLETGKDADIVLMNDDCDVLRTILRGETIYTAE